MMRETKLAKGLYWLGDSVEALGPSVYRVLASVLPYLTPFPVAVLTAKSVEGFLGFDGNVAFIFVFGLEGIGIWFTGMFVEAVVEWLTSRNPKTFWLILMFGAVVAVYVYILVSLNVTLKSETDSEKLSKVVTLMCFLPLLTGVGNGYYKMKLEKKREAQKALERKEQAEKEEKDRQAALLQKQKDAELSFQREKFYVKHGIIPEGSGNFPEGVRTFEQVSGTVQKVSKSSKKVSPELSSLVESIRKVSGDWRKLSIELSSGPRNNLETLANLSPDQMREIEQVTGYTYKTISNWRGNARSM